MIRYPIFIPLSFLFAMIVCGPKAEKAMSFRSSSAYGQLYPEQPWRFNPEFAIDGKSNTAFCADSKIGSNIGFTLFLNSITEFSAIQVTNGFSKSLSESAQFSQVKKLNIKVGFLKEVGGGEIKIVDEESIFVDLSPVSFSGSKPTAQTIETGKKLKGNAITFSFTEIHSGSKSKNVCLSEFSVGELIDKKFKKHPVLNEETIKSKIASFDMASRHFNAFGKLVTANEAGSINFWNQAIALPVFFKSDNTFSFSEMYTTSENPPDTGFSQAKQGSYLITSTDAQGMNLTVTFFDPSGVEQNESWIFKRVSQGDEDFDHFKTRMGTSFSEVFDSKKTYLLLLRNVSSGETFYNYEISLK